MKQLQQAALLQGRSTLVALIVAGHERAGAKSAGCEGAPSGERQLVGLSSSL